MSALRAAYPLFTGGEWLAGQGVSAASVDPSTGEEIARVTDANEADLEAAVEAAAAAAPDWAATPWAERPQTPASVSSKMYIATFSENPGIEMGVDAVSEQAPLHVLLGHY